ncbi:MAG: GNAT family N-acetyltransferase [Bacteroidales bacterium]
MAEINIERYIPERRGAWDEMVSSSRNGTFLFMRGYMDYHADRFVDHSLMFTLRGKLMAVLPANEIDSVIWSHQGLTYGGLLVSEYCKGADVMKIFASLMTYLKDAEIKKIFYKPIPHIYHSQPSEEELYALFRNGAHLTGRALSSALSPSLHTHFCQLRRRCIKKGLDAGVNVCEESDFSAFWEILSANLKDRHNVHPVHSLAEIMILKSRFPENIRLYTAKICSVTVAGVIVYETAHCAHAQYIAASNKGRECGALDVIFSHLITSRYRDIPYFDFGISTESGGILLNLGLLSQKEGFGAKGIVYDTYEICID